MISAWLTFLNFGPYHLSRFHACEKIPGFDFVPIAMAKSQSEYGWKLENDPRIQFVEQDRYLESVRGNEWKQKLKTLMRKNRPDVVFVAGYSHPSMLSLILLCVEQSIPWILMSDSREVDVPRRFWREETKKRIVRLASTGFVAGSPHTDYLKMLGMREVQISQGYDVVDNEYFSEQVAQCRFRTKSEHSLSFLLASCRFIEVKNLLRLITAYSIYVKRSMRSLSMQSEESAVLPMCPLVLLGDGPMRPKIEHLCLKLGIEIVNSAPWEMSSGTTVSSPTLFLPGFRQIGDLPRFYSQAIAFILASTSDTWGLVVNEAMASGLPVLVSRGCGCAQDLVQDGINGWTFDPSNHQELADLMFKVVSMSPVERTEMGFAGRQIIDEWGPDRFAEGCKESAERAVGAGPKKPSVLDLLLLSVLIRR